MTGTPRKIVWARLVTPQVAIGLDDSLTLVLEVTVPGRDKPLQLTLSNGDDMIDAIQTARTFRDAALAEPDPFAWLARLRRR